MVSTTRKQLDDSVDALIDIICSRSIPRVTTGILRTFSLIYANIVNHHLRRELQILVIRSLEARRHSQVKDDVLENVCIPFVSCAGEPFVLCVSSAVSEGRRLENSGPWDDESSFGTRPSTSSAYSCKSSRCRCVKDLEV